MNELYKSLITQLQFGKNPYDGFPAGEWRGHWYNDPGAKREMFTDCVRTFSPRLIIEVGSFVGESAIFMANAARQLGLDTVILCIDTWLGGVDHWLKAKEKLLPHFGRSSLYYQFMANVIVSGNRDVIVPLALDSMNAARLLGHLGIKADLIYIDASHEEGDVLRDYHAYWPLLNPGGGFLVDDLTGWFPGVVSDFDKFCKETGITPRIEGEKGLLIKP